MVTIKDVAIVAGVTKMAEAAVKLILAQMEGKLVDIEYVMPISLIKRKTA